MRSPIVLPALCAGLLVLAGCEQGTDLASDPVPVEVTAPEMDPEMAATASAEAEAARQQWATRTVGLAGTTAAAIAGTADRSPASRCQSACGSGLYAPPGPMNATRSPGCASRAQGPASPSSPCTTKSRASVSSARSTERTVYVRVTGTSSPGRVSRRAARS